MFSTLQRSSIFHVANLSKSAEPATENAHCVTLCVRSGSVLQAGDNFDLRSALFDLVILIGGPHLNDSWFFSFALPVAAFWAAVRSSLGLLKSTVISEGEFGIECARWADFQPAHSIPLDAKPNSAAV